MLVGKRKSAVGVFPECRSAELALRELKDAEFPMHHISVLAQSTNWHDELTGVDFNSRQSRQIAEGASKGLTNLIGNPTNLLLPGVGPVVVVGSLAETLAKPYTSDICGTAAGGLVGVLVCLGVPEDLARFYNERVGKGNYVVVVEETENLIEQVERILRYREIRHWGIFEAPEATAESPEEVDASPSDVNTTSHTTYATPNAYHLHTFDESLPKGHYRHAGGMFEHPQETEEALLKLQLNGFPMAQVAVVVQETHPPCELTSTDTSELSDSESAASQEETSSLTSARNQPGKSATAGGFSGGMTSLLVISGTKQEIRHAEALLGSSGIQEEGKYYTRHLELH